MNSTVHLLKIQAECYVQLARIANRLADASTGDRKRDALHELQAAVKQLHIATTGLLNNGRRPDGWWFQKVLAANAELRRYVG
jgi:hypothetical protein